MTVSNTLRRAGPFTGNGVTVSFPFTFKIFQTIDILVTELDIASGAESYPLITTNYSVTLNADQDANPGGSVVAVIAPPATKKWTLTSAIGALQDADLVGGSGWYPQVVENALDRAVALIQQLQEALSRSLLLPISFNLTALLPTPSAFKLLGWNAAATALVNYSPGTGSVTVINAFTKNQYSVPYVLTPGVTVEVPATESNNFTLAAAQSFTLANPTDLADGMVLNFRIKQDATGGRVVTWGSKYKFPGGTAGVLSTAANAVDFMSCYYDGPSDTLDCVINKAFA